MSPISALTLCPAFWSGNCALKLCTPASLRGVMVVDYLRRPWENPLLTPLESKEETSFKRHLFQLHNQDNGCKKKKHWVWYFNEFLFASVCLCAAQCSPSASEKDSGLSLSWLNSAPWKFFGVLREHSQIMVQKKMAAPWIHYYSQCPLPSVNFQTGCFSTFTVDVAIMTKTTHVMIELKKPPVCSLGKLFQIIVRMTSW